MMRLHLFTLLLAAFATYAAAASAPTFCKCTCFTNSTIIPLGPQSDGASIPALKPQSREAAGSLSLRSLLGNIDPASTSSSSSPPIDRRASSASCAQCNRAFCLEYNLPICKGAEEKDIVTMCFQRDSRKDMIIVWAFILGTTGLMGWAAAKKVVEFREGKLAAAGGLPVAAADRGQYVPVGSEAAR